MFIVTFSPPHGKLFGSGAFTFVTNQTTVTWFTPSTFSRFLYTIELTLDVHVHPSLSGRCRSDCPSASDGTRRLSLEPPRRWTWKNERQIRRRLIKALNESEKLFISRLTRIAILKMSQFVITEINLNFSCVDGSYLCVWRKYFDPYECYYVDNASNLN